MRVAYILRVTSYELHLLCELRVASCTYYASCELRVERKVRVGNSKVRVETKSASISNRTQKDWVGPKLLSQ